MSKYIDADALIERINKKYIGNLAQVSVDFAAKRIINSINKMSTAEVEQEPRWISVNKRLPEDFKECIVAKSNAQVKSGAYYNKANKRWLWDCLPNGTEITDVIAWMPLPEPPKMDGDSNEL